MSNGIRGRPPGQGPTNIPQPQVEEKSSAKGTSATKDAQAPAETSDTPADVPVDKFERGAEAGALNRLQQLVGNRGPGAPKMQFTNEDLRLLAQQFAAVLLGKPTLSRADRAKAFAEIILKKSKKLKKLFGHLKPQEMEEMCDAIGNLLDSSPKFGQLVDDVSEEAGKMNS